MIHNLNNINSIVAEEKLDILVVSCGGSGSNNLVDILEQNGYKCRSPIWIDLLCHCPTPINVDIPIIYIYRNIIDAFFSIKRRGYWGINQRKLSNNKNVTLSDRNLFESMAKQFTNWKNSNLRNLLFIHYDECFNDSIKEKLSSFLNNNNLINLPSLYKTPKTNYNLKELDIRLINLFNMNKEVIEESSKIVEYIKIEI